MNRNSSKQHLVEGLVTYDFTLRLRVRDLTTSFWRFLGTAFGHFEDQPPNGTWHMVNTAQTVGAFTQTPPLQLMNGSILLYWIRHARVCWRLIFYFIKNNNNVCVCVCVREFSVLRKIHYMHISSQYNQSKDWLIWVAYKFIQDNALH